MRKFLSFVCVVVFSLICVLSAGCNTVFLDFGEEVDTTKTQLYVSNYNGGIGSTWLEKVIDRFEEEYADTEFTEGHVGVQIIVNNNKEMRTDLQSTLENGPSDEVYFAEHVYYREWAEEDLLLDISDIVTEDLTTYGEEGSIEDKLSDEKKAMLQAPNGSWNGGTFTSGGKYYALPHYEGFQGITYNVTLFDQFGLYFNTDGEIIGGGGSTVKSAGPDNVLGTTDDGLPASIEQFIELCNYMVSATTVTPFVWTGMYSEYFTILLDALTTAQLGKEGSEVLYTFNEDLDENEKTVSTLITDFDSDGNPVFGTTTVDETTAYLLWQQSALYYSLDFADNLLNSATGAGKWYTSESINGSYSHLDAQADFVDGTYDTSNQIAMLIDGNYWENEAADSIARSESIYNYSYEDSANFAWMPLPTVALTEDIGDEEYSLTMKDAMQAYAFIYSGIEEDKIDLAKTFLQFCYTDESLKEFTLTTGSTRDLDYDLTDEEVATMSNYAQSIWNYLQVAEIVDTSSVYTVFTANEEALTNNFWYTYVNGANQNRPYTAFWTAGATAQSFFEGMATLHTRSSWDSANRSYYDLHDQQSDELITLIS